MVLVEGVVEGMGVEDGVGGIEGGGGGGDGVVVVVVGEGGGGWGVESKPPGKGGGGLADIPHPLTGKFILTNLALIPGEPRREPCSKRDREILFTEYGGT